MKQSSWLTSLRSVAAMFALGTLVSSVRANEASTPTVDTAPSFRRDIMPIFFRAGCNSGTCHGSSRGKDGFRLSLFGYDARGDYERLTLEMVGRRVNSAMPEQSLLLLKAIGGVPHTGGKLFEKDSKYYQTIHKWIAAGAPDDNGDIADTVEVRLTKKSLLFEKPGESAQVKAFARNSDGSTRDVTDLARFQTNDPSVATIDANGKVTSVGPGDTNVFARFSRFSVGAEVIVLPQDANFQWTNPPKANYIDELVYDRLQKLRIVPSPLCDDETFLRRVHLDLTGKPPTVEEYRTFMADKQPDKRTQKIDALLNTDAFADLWTAIWAESLRIKGGGYAPVATDVKAADKYYAWIRQQMRAKRPLNEFVGEMVTASGSNIRSGPVNLYTMLVHKPRFAPKEFAADFSQLFLGTQIQCAECHNHPFDRWTMDDYYGLVSFFTGVKRKSGAEPREMTTFIDPNAPPANHLVDGRPMPATAIGEDTAAPAGVDSRVELARWLTSPDNELFSRNIANRIWAQVMGRGIVEPVDDMRVSNPPVNAPLLDALNKRLVDSKFDLRAVVRDICTSNVYQASSATNASNQRDKRQFSHAKLRHLRSDVLLDAIMVAANHPYQFGGFPRGTRAIDYYPRSEGSTEGPDAGDSFFHTFGRSKRATVCACETKNEPTLSQALHLIVGGTVEERIRSGGVSNKLIQAGATPEAIIEELFIRALGRKPTADELQASRAAVGEAVKDPAPYDDIFWSLLNSTEFSFNH